MALPYTGVRILDLSRALAGPFCTQLLSDLGAEVIKVEQPGVGDNSRAWGPPFEGGESSYYLSLNRNKRGLALDLRRTGSAEVLTRLLATCDVLVENFVPGTLARLGFSYERCRQIRPDLIYCAISGFGLVGPQRERPAYDQILQGLGGIMSLTGDPGQPPVRIGVAIADLTAGIFAALALGAAIHHRARTGEGQLVDTSLLDGQVALMSYQAARYFATGVAPEPVGRQHPTIVPYGVYACADGYINLGVGTDDHWRRCCRALQLDELAADERYATNTGRVAHRAELNAVLEPRLRAWPTAELEAALVAAEVPAGAVRDLAGVFADEQVHALNLVRTMAHPTAGAIRVLAPPFRLSASPPELRLPPPRLGEHTRAILAELGYSWPEIVSLHEQGTVASAD